MSAHASAGSLVRSFDQRKIRAAVDASLVVFGSLAYFSIRHMTRSSHSTAMKHASWVQSFESRLGIHREVQVQRLFVHHPMLVTLFDDIYIYGHWPVIAAALSWLLWRHPDHFRIAGAAMTISGTLALAVFAFFPVAPPRLADRSVIDTVTLHSDAYRVLQPPAFTNAYAAMPSLHCGWDLVIAVCLMQVASRTISKIAIALLPALMIMAVVVTGNHYIVDVIAGDGLALSSVFIARAWASRRETALNRSRRWPLVRETPGNIALDAVATTRLSSSTTPALDPDLAPDGSTEDSSVSQVVRTLRTLGRSIHRTQRALQSAKETQ